MAAPQPGKPLDVGDRVPSFSLADQDGASFQLEQALGRGPLVFFFYPKDETPTCTREACSFRDAHADLHAGGAQVFGISSDSEASHKSFATHHRLPYRLLADEGGHVRDEVFGVPRGLLGLRPGRATYVVDAEGIVRHRFQKHLAAQEHVDEALAVVKKLRKG
jgi:thioredoxin-dependent peroxiredoxin